MGKSQNGDAKQPINSYPPKNHTSSPKTANFIFAWHQDTHAATPKLLESLNSHETETQQLIFLKNLSPTGNKKLINLLYQPKYPLKGVGASEVEF